MIWFLFLWSSWKVHHLWSSGHPGADDTGNTWFTWSCWSGQYSMGTATTANTMRLGQKKKRKKRIFKGKNFWEFRKSSKVSGVDIRSSMFVIKCVPADTSWQSLSWGLSWNSDQKSLIYIYIPSLKLTFSHLKIGHPKRKLVFQTSIFSCELSVSGRAKILTGMCFFPNMSWGAVEYFWVENLCFCCCYLIYRWVFPKNRGGPPKKSILIEFSIINHPFWDTPIFGNTHLVFLDQVPCRKQKNTWKDRACFHHRCDFHSTNHIQFPPSSHLCTSSNTCEFNTKKHRREKGSKFP